MAKKIKQKHQAQKRETNWLLIGGVIAIGVIALFGLLFLSLREPEQETLADYCANNPTRCITQGNANARVTVVEVSDFGCVHCRNFHRETKPLLDQQFIDTNQIQWVVLPYALSATTQPAANAAMCANEQNAFFEYSEALFAQQDQPVALTRAGFEQAAEELGLQMDTFTQCLSDGRYNTVINNNVNAARLVRVSATPTFFINNQLLEGAQPFTVFQQRISSLLNN